MADTTGALTSEEVSQRGHFFLPLIAVAVAAVFFVAVAAAYARSFRTLHAKQKQQKLPEDWEAMDKREQQGFLAPSSAPSTASGSSPKDKEVENDPEKEVEKMAENEQEGRLEANAGFVRKRDIALAVLFVVYVLSCTAVPLAGWHTLTCRKGFFWELHMVFLFIFVATKLAEVYLYAFDPTLTGSLGIFVGEKGFPLGVPDGFCWKFVMSFLGYADGYQDMASILVALACPDELSQKLGTCMLVCYVVGVVCAQWLVMSCLAFRDPTKACFAKLLHMDAFAAGITLPPDQQWTWRMVHAARTFGEDLPQAVLQTLYILYVKENPLMIVSVCMAVGGSMLALKDAITRSLVAAGFRFDGSRGVKSIYVARGWAIHGVTFVRRNNELSGTLLSNDGHEMDIAKTWLSRDRRHGDDHSLQLQPGEYLVQVSGVNNNGSMYLCQELTFRTNRGRSQTFAGEQMEWYGEPFDFPAPDGHAIVGLRFATRGLCSGIKTERV